MRASGWKICLGVLLACSSLGLGLPAAGASGTELFRVLAPRDEGFLQGPSVAIRVHLASGASVRSAELNGTNVKQLLRAYRGDGHAGANGNEAPGNVGPGGNAGPGGFDERQYGFGGLMDLMRACQKEGLLRVERDRRGGLRVFPGQALQRTEQPQDQTPREPAELQAVASERAETQETEPEHEEIERIPVDTTAELLGRASAKPRRPRQPSSRVGASAPRGTRKAAAAAGPRKPAARRAPRAAKVPRTDVADEGNE